MTGAIVIAEGNRESASERAASPSSPKIATRRNSLAGVDLLGLPVIARLVQDLARREILTETSLLLDTCLSDSSLSRMPAAASHATSDVWTSATGWLLKARQKGLDSILIVRAGAYIEFNLEDFVQFHREGGEAVTRAGDEDGALDLWMVDPAGVPDIGDLRTALYGANAQYEVRGYVNRLEDLSEMRRLVIDALTSRCRFRPHALEVRPGLWIAEGAQVGRGARIVAPAFLGRNVKISEQCLITRCTNVESGSQVDYGTVVEDSSILSKTYVGIGLDLSHSVADGARLVNLHHGVALEIPDPVVMRRVRVNRARADSRRPLLSDFQRKESAFVAAERREK